MSKSTAITPRKKSSVFARKLRLLLPRPRRFARASDQWVRELLVLATHALLSKVAHVLTIIVQMVAIIKTVRVVVIRAMAATKVKEATKAKAAIKSAATKAVIKAMVATKAIAVIKAMAAIKARGDTKAKAAIAQVAIAAIVLVVLAIKIATSKAAIKTVINKVVSLKTPTKAKVRVTPIMAVQR